MSDLRKFAERLINVDCESVEKMAKLLEEEYGIVAAAPPVSVKDKATPELKVSNPAKRQAQTDQRPDWTVPRQIGKTSRQAGGCFFAAVDAADYILLMVEPMVQPFFCVCLVDKNFG